MKELGIQMKPSPRDLLSGADANEDEVSIEAIFKCTENQIPFRAHILLDTTCFVMLEGYPRELSYKLVGLFLSAQQHDSIDTLQSAGRRFCRVPGDDAVCRAKCIDQKAAVPEEPEKPVQQIISQLCKQRKSCDPQTPARVF